MVRRLFAALAAAALFGVGAARADLIIDDFASPVGGQIAIDSTNNGMPSVNVLAGQPVLGGSRELIVNKTGQIGGGAQTVSASSNEVGTQIFNFDQFSSTARGSARAIYDGGADGLLNPTGFASGVDFTDSGINTGFLFEDLTVTGSGLELTVNLYNDATGLAYTSGPQLLLNGFTGDFFLPYATFFGAGGAGTLTNVGALEILVDGTSLAASGSDLTFNLISSAPAVVPEPSSLTLAGIALLSGAGMRWRKRRLG